MNKGLDITIKGVTAGHHFNMIKEHIRDGGNIDWKHLLDGGEQIVTRSVWGHTYKILFRYCPYDEILIAECVK